MCLRITAGTGWTKQTFVVTAIVSGKWQLHASPAATSTSGGTWSFGCPDLRLNNNTGGGALLRGTAPFAKVPGIPSPADCRDFGAYQHQDAGGGTTGYFY